MVALNFPEAVWINCEIAACNTSRGHRFLNLLEKGEGEREILAQADAVIWSRQYKKLYKELGKDVEQLLQSGRQVRLKARIDFHERFGLKLVVETLDLAYSIGQLALQKKAIIDRLQAEQLLAKNTSIALPLVLQRIAVLSAENAAGWKDFEAQLAQNDLGYHFDIQLFSTALQGVNVRREIIQQLKRIKKSKTGFDAVVLIRGGGAKLDLTAFDDYEIAKTMANFPLPILTGIGHEVDESIVDLVVHKALKTPTAVADFILSHNTSFEGQLLQAFQQIQWLAQQHLQQAAVRLGQLDQMQQFAKHTYLQQQQKQLTQISQTLPYLVASQLQKADSKLSQLAQLANFLSLEASLNRGFSLITQQQKVVTNATMIDEKVPLKIRFKDGEKVIIIKQTEE